MKKYWFLTLSVLLFSAVLKGQSLEYFVDLTIQNHPEVKAKNLQLEAFENREKQITSYDDPMLSAAYNVTPNSMEKFNVSLMQNFSWFGTAKHQRAAAKHASLSNSVGLNVYKEQLKITVSELYFQLYELEQLQKLQQQNINLFSYLSTLANNKLSTGSGTMVDVIRAEMAEENSQIEIEILKQKHRALSEKLNVLSGRKPSEKIETEAVLYSAVSPESDIANHLKVIEINHRIEESTEIIKATKKESAPVIGIGVEYMRMEPQRNEIMPMVSVSLPIFRKKYKAKIEEAELLGKSAQFEKEWIENQLIQERIFVKSEIVQAETEMDLYSGQIKKAKQAKDLLINYYSSSGERFEEIVRLQQEELNYQILQIQAETRALQLSKEWSFLNNASQPSK